MDDANNSYEIVSASEMGLPVDILKYLDVNIKKYWTGVYSSWTYLVEHKDERKKYYARIKSAFPLLKKAYEEKGWDFKAEFDDWSYGGKISFKVSKQTAGEIAIRRKEEYRIKQERPELVRKQDELREEKIIDEIRPNSLILIAKIICDLRKSDNGQLMMRNLIHEDEMTQLCVNITSEDSDTTYADKAHLFANRFSLLTKSSFFPIEINRDGFRLVCVTLNKGLKGRITTKLKKNIEDFVSNKKSVEFRKLLFKTQISYIGSPVTYKLYYSLLLLEALQNPDTDSAYEKVVYPVDRFVPKNEIITVVTKLNTYFNSKYYNFELLDSNEQAFAYLSKNNLLGEGAYLCFKKY